MSCRLRGDDDRGGGEGGQDICDRDGLQEHHHGQALRQHAGGHHRVQHRPLRLRDRRQVPQRHRRQEGADQAAGIVERSCDIIPVIYSRTPGIYTKIYNRIFL